MANLITYANGFEKSAIIIESIKAEYFLNRKCKPEIRERIEKVSQKIKEQSDKNYDEREVLLWLEF